MFRKAIMILGAVLLTSCGIPAPAPPQGEPACAAKADTTFLTYNVAEGWDMVAMPGLRSPHVAEALADASFDVACVQEAWNDEFRDAILDSVNLPYGHTFVADTVDHGETGEDVCTKADLDPVRACADAKCSDLAEPHETGMCVRKSCAKETVALFAAKKLPCLRCLGAMAGRPIAETYDTCTGEGASRIHGGRNGIMLLSRKSRLWNKEVLPLPASNANKVALIATVRVETADGTTADVEVACTHVSANNSLGTSHSGYATWDEEKKAQIDAMAARLAERSLEHGGNPTVIMGDLNAGPATVRGAAAASPAVWDEMILSGYESPAADAQKGTACSSCADNTLGGGKADHLIDHVAFRNAPDAPTALMPLCADRQFTRPVKFAGYDGKELETNLSDHYGIRVLFDIERR